MATIQREPHRIARYALDLASIFHSFYTHCHVLGEKFFWMPMVLVKCVQIVKRSLDLLGIQLQTKDGGETFIIYTRVGR